MVEIYEGKVVIYICTGCSDPCVFTRRPKPGDRIYPCWEGGEMLVGEPEKKEADDERDK